MTMPPWHMWGSVANQSLRSGQIIHNQQLARIAYKRPESWRFMFYARILRSFLTTPPASVLVTFEVSQGTGRGNISIPNFENYIFQITLGGEQGASNPKFSTQVLGAARSDLVATDPRSVVDVIVAQDIQVGFSCLLSSGLPPTDEVQLEAGCSLAPWHHARPEWLVHEFGGEELHGR